MNNSMTVLEITNAKIDFIQKMLEKAKQGDDRIILAFCEGMKYSLNDLSYTLVLANEGKMTLQDAATISM